MNDNLTQIAVVLDRTGSMEPIKGATIDAFNEFFNGQKKLPGEARVFLVQFDSEDPFEIICDKPLADVPLLTATNYQPRANTPLHDAMARTIIELGRRLESIPEPERPGKIIMVTLTDGQENASREYTRQQVAEMVQHQRDKYGWDFVFLGANQDAVLTAAGFNIPQHAAMTYNANKQSVRNVSASLGNYTAARRAGRRACFTQDDRKNARR